MCIICNEELVAKMNIKELKGVVAEMLNTKPEDKDHIKEAYEAALKSKMEELYEAGYFF